MALPPLTAAQIMLLLDRYLGAHFFDTGRAGGSACVCGSISSGCFGHPEVLHPDTARVRVRFRDRPRVLAETDFLGRAAMIGATVAIGLVSGERVGPPHVCRRNVRRIEHLLCRLNHAGWRFPRESKFSTGWQPCTAANFRF